MVGKCVNAYALVAAVYARNSYCLAFAVDYLMNCDNVRVALCRTLAAAQLMEYCDLLWRVNGIFFTAV
jgi:hypothetical protein